MKFSFKIQQYQTDAVDAVVRIFQGQSYNAGVPYMRDMGGLCVAFFSFYHMSACASEQLLCACGTVL